MAKALISKSKSRHQSDEDDKRFATVHRIARSGNVYDMLQVKYLTMKVNSKSENDETPLHFAAYAGDAAAVSVLICKGADVNALEITKQPPLHWAVMEKHLDVVKTLVRQGASVNAADMYGITALHMSVYHRFTDIVEYLLENGALVNAQDDEKQTPLHIAIERGHDRIVQILLGHDADTNIKDKCNRTPTDLAACYRDLVHSRHMPQTEESSETKGESKAEQSIDKTRVPTSSSHQLNKNYRDRLKGVKYPSEDLPVTEVSQVSPEVLSSMSQSGISQTAGHSTKWGQSGKSRTNVTKSRPGLEQLFSTPLQTDEPVSSSTQSRKSSQILGVQDNTSFNTPCLEDSSSTSQPVLESSKGVPKTGKLFPKMTRSEISSPDTSQSYKPLYRPLKSAKSRYNFSPSDKMTASVSHLSEKPPGASKKDKTPSYTPHSDTSESEDSETPSSPGSFSSEFFSDTASMRSLDMDISSCSTSLSDFSLFSSNKSDKFSSGMSQTSDSSLSRARRPHSLKTLQNTSETAPAISISSSKRLVTSQKVPMQPDALHSSKQDTSNLTNTQDDPLHNDNEPRTPSAAAKEPPSQLSASPDNTGSQLPSQMESFLASLPTTSAISAAAESLSPQTLPSLALPTMITSTMSAPDGLHTAHLRPAATSTPAMVPRANSVDPGRDSGINPSLQDVFGHFGFGQSNASNNNNVLFQFQIFMGSTINQGNTSINSNYSTNSNNTNSNNTNNNNTTSNSNNTYNNSNNNNTRTVNLENADTVGFNSQMGFAEPRDRASDDEF